MRVKVWDKNENIRKDLIEESREIINEILREQRRKGGKKG